MKRGQITVFIILGILILLGVGFAIYMQGRAEKLPLETAPRFDRMDSNTLQKYVEDCIAETTTSGVYIIAAQGGYVAPKGSELHGDAGDDLPMHYYVDEGVVPFVLYENDSTLRPLQDVRLALERYVAAELPKCLDFSEAQSWGYTVKQPQINWSAIDFDFSKAAVDYSTEKVGVTADLRPEGDLLVQVNWPLLFSGDESFSLSKFQVTLPLRLALLHKIASRLTDQIGRADVANLQYNVGDHCEEYAPYDKSVNIYVLGNRFVEEALIVVVDGKPTSIGLAPLRFNIAVRNVKVDGVCLG